MNAKKTKKQLEQENEELRKALSDARRDAVEWRRAYRDLDNYIAACLI